MLMRPGETWHCINTSCGTTVVVQVGTKIDGANPHCSCGAAMKKKYTSPVFRYLDFLRIEDPVLSARTSSEEQKD